MKNTLRSYLLANTEATMGLVREVNAWNGALDFIDFIDMELFDEYMYEVPPTDLANMIHFGSFNPNNDYFQFNAYGNLVSYDEYEAEAEIENYIDEILEAVIECKDNIDINNDVIELFLEAIELAETE